MSKLEKIEEIINKNNFDIEFDSVLAARVVLAAWGIQAQANDVKYATLGLYSNGNLVAKVRMPEAQRGWFWGFGGYKYESPRVANLVGFVVDFENGIFKGNRAELGFDKGLPYKLGYDYEIYFDEIKILKGADALQSFNPKAEVYA